jgi:hypothetical protein
MGKSAAALTELRASWPGGDRRERLVEAAARLNAEEPRAPALGDLICGGSGREGSVTLGLSQTAEWVSPALIARTGTPRWDQRRRS